MGANFRTAVTRLYDSWLDDERLIEVRHMVADPGEDGTSADYHLHYIASLCSGALLFGSDEFCHFFCGLEKNLRDWKKRAQIGDDFSSECVANDFLNDVITKLLVSVETSPYLLANVITGVSESRNKDGHRKRWDSIVDEFVSLTKSRCKIPW